MVEVVFDLLLPLVMQLIERCDSITGVAVIRRYHDDLVVHFAVIFKIQHAEDPTLQENARRYRVVRQYERIKFITIIVLGLRYEAVVARLGKDTRLDAIQFKRGQFAVPLDLKRRPFRNLNDSIYSIRGLIARGEACIEVRQGISVYSLLLYTID